MRMIIAALLGVIAFSAAAQTIQPDQWPTIESPVRRDPAIEKAVTELLAKMSLEEKVGQVIQPSITAVTPNEVRSYHIGSVLNGGGGWPGDVRKATPADWLKMADAFYEASMDTTDGSNAIPVMWGADAVHGHNNIVGATLFPHNVGLGATRNPELIRRIGEVTAVEMRTTGIDWDFSPTVAVARDDRWGRAYESYSEDPEVVRELGQAMVQGLQGTRPSFLGVGKVIATAKHFVGDGGTTGGVDQGDNRASEAELRDIHAAGYIGALQAGVQTIMASYNSWRGTKMHGNRTLLTDVLKKQMRFDGILVGDWNGHGQIPGCTNGNCPKALSAGLDIYMVPEDWKALYENTLAQVKSGEIPKSRLDDAVKRILRVKMRAGLFTAGKPSQRPLGGDFAKIGAREHRDVARQAVRESLVLLKNNGGVLPLKIDQKVLVAGDGANSIAKQCGGWTLTWQGDGNTNADFPGGTSIWDGIRIAAPRATLSVDGSFGDKPDVAVVVYGEDPYAEFQGDRKHIVYDRSADLELLRRLKDAGIPVVSIFLSGRPLWVNAYLNASDAFVAAWLPGTEGNGVADVLFGGQDFKGKLAFSWPKLPTQVPLNFGQTKYDPLFPLGFGLTYKDKKELSQLTTDTSGVDLTGGVRFEVKPNGEIGVKGSQPVNLTRESNGDMALSIDYKRTEPGPVKLTLGAASLDVTSLLSDGGTTKIRLKCFAEKGADVSKVSGLRIEGPVTVSSVKLEPSVQTPCP